MAHSDSWCVGVQFTHRTTAVAGSGGLDHRAQPGPGGRLHSRVTSATRWRCSVRGVSRAHCYSSFFTVRIAWCGPAKQTLVTASGLLNYCVILLIDQCFCCCCCCCFLILDYLLYHLVNQCFLLFKITYCVIL